VAKRDTAVSLGFLGELLGRRASAGRPSVCFRGTRIPVSVVLDNLTGSPAISVAVRRESLLRSTSAASNSRESTRRLSMEKEGVVRDACARFASGKVTE